MEKLLEAIILGLVQGIAEWLPISSTGHLRLAEHFLQLSMPILFDVILHIGTLAVIFIFFRKDIKSILTAFVQIDFKSESGRLIPLLIVGSLPTALIGLVFGDWVESTFSNILPISIALICCGSLLFASKLARENTEIITFQTALIFGTAQGIAVIPGLSRSGTTITIALLLGLKREKAFSFSFLLSIPAIIGALGLTLYKEHEALIQAGFSQTEIAAGAVVALLAGYVALRMLHKVIKNKKLHIFAFYCWVFGTALLVLGLNGF